MTSSRLLKVFALLSLLSILAAVWLWHVTGEAPSHWLDPHCRGYRFWRLS